MLANSKETHFRSFRSHVARSIGPVIGLSIFVLAGFMLHRELQSYRLADIVQEFREIPFSRIAAAFGTAIASYAAVTVYDALAMRSIGRRMHYARTALAAFVAAAFSNNIGFGVLTGGSVRFRLYSALDVSIEEITRIIVFFTVTLWLGFSILAGSVFLVESVSLPAGFSAWIPGTRFIGIVFLLLAGAYVAATLAIRRPIPVFGLELSFTPPRFLPAQLVFSVLDWGLAGATLFLLMPTDLGLTFSRFLSYYLLALTVGMLSQVPGGIGVFESMIVLLLKDHVETPRLLGALLAYRATYYLLPLLFGAALMAGREAYLRRKGLKAAAGALGRWSGLITAPLLSFAVVLAGAILLVSGATPPEWTRFHVLARVVPVSLLEGSHFLGSVVGMGLIVLAQGIRRRVDVAYLATTVLLGAGIVFSLLKGWDYEEAILLAVILVLLLPARSHFSRSSLLLAYRFSPGWIAVILAVLAGTVWLTIFSHSHVQYTSELWWQFALDRSAPRSMRALVGAVTVLVGASLAALLRPHARATAVGGDAVDWAGIERAVRASPNTLANLVYLGDKQILVGPSGNSFLMYGVSGRNFVAMGDPIGAEEDWKPLVWEFRQIADRCGANAAFYEVRVDTLPLYLDIGLSVLKFGEEARVPLAGFGLEGAARKGLRYVVNKLTREGWEFEMLTGEAVVAEMRELREVSDAWLSHKNTREKSFSLGSFSEGYVARMPVGVVRRDGRITAFANLWAGDAREEVSIDLMRHREDAPSGVMDYLFVQLMLWAKAQGLEWFNLGMAPLSGLEEYPTAPVWNRAGAFLFRHGEHFYNFQGLRAYKEKFDPLWRPKYIATPGGLAIPSVLTSLATLSSGGVVGIVTKV